MAIFSVLCSLVFLQAEGDAVNLLAGAKTQSNPENSVGVLSLAGKVPRVLVTPTDDLGQVLNAVHGISTGGSIKLSTGVQVCQPQPRFLSLLSREGKFEESCQHQSSAASCFGFHGLKSLLP